MSPPRTKEDRPFSQGQRKFAQERARRTYEALLEAATWLFKKKGYDATQTPDIAARAGVSVGTFYRYFTDKREVFLEIMQRHMERAQREIIGNLTPDKFAGAERRATIDRTLEVLMDAINAEPELERVFLEMAMRDEEVARLRLRVEKAGVGQLAQLIASISPKERVSDPEAIAYVIHVAVVEAAMRIAGFRGKSPIPRDRGIRALSDIVYRALFDD